MVRNIKIISEYIFEVNFGKEFLINKCRTCEYIRVYYIVI